ncbi:hypothetical protein [Paenibacillus larvae]|uniref:hypothetical protein n=1 Tax=Paenibacillus larvae TaxID=1464 RepID=UPI002282CE3A|nr:hypothetical protein [Paenibacillus larvae]MCY7477653.1 hypothetical protein [Paenibacillus larvae]MDE5166399.1 hypothetical protein [Paenibacillus larvae subsp. larvae]
MNKFKIELFEKAFENYNKHGNSETWHQCKNGDDWMYFSEAIRHLEDEGYITTDDFDPDEDDVFLAIAKPIRYELTTKGLSYIKEG